ncbi:MAG: amidohydrolase family protein, partial [Pseudomonadota bacterium]
TSGADNFEDFKRIIERSRVRILAFLNISRTGMDTGENEPKNFNVKLAADTAKKYDDTIVGFKSAHYWRRWKGDHVEFRPFDDVHSPWASVDSLVQAGRLAGKPVMVDFDPLPAQGNRPARPYRELLLEKLRPGDIHTHCYARRFKVMGEDGKVVPHIFKARERGVLFDVGHGGGSMLFRNAIPAIEQGYLPDTISSDLHAGNVNGPVVNLGFVLSKFLNMGMSLEEILQRVTVNPAKAIGRPDLGTLTAGSPADIAVFKVIKEDITFVDSRKSRLKGDRYLRNVMTVSDGRIVFNPYGLGLGFWNEIKGSSPGRPHLSSLSPSGALSPGLSASPEKIPCRCRRPG